MTANRDRAITGEAPYDEGRRICVGRIVGAQGVRGAVRVKSFTADPAAIARYGALSDRAGSRRYTLRVTGQSSGALIARIAGVVDRDQALALKGTDLFVERAALPAPAEDEFYHADLIGLAAVTTDGRDLGRVTAVHDFGAGDVLEIAGSTGTHMVPFRREIVPVVDLAATRLEIAPVPGLLDGPGTPDPGEMAGEAA
jgi:16S rRNA processing protein RimM